MDNDMRQKTKAEALTRLRRQYARAGLPYKLQLLDQASALFGYHRKAAIRPLRAQPPPPRTAAVLLGRPREYDPQALLPVLKSDLVGGVPALRLALGGAAARLRTRFITASIPTCGSV